MELDEAIGQFAYPGSPIDYIVIEASGLAEPADLARSLRAAMTPQTHLDSIVAVVDAANWHHNADTAATVRQQIEHSDFVVINKTDLASESEVGTLKALITSVNNRARLFMAVNAAVDVDLLLGSRIHNFPTLSATDNHDHDSHSHLHEQFASVSFTSAKPLDPVALQAFVNQQIPTTVYRAKGIINLGAKGHNRKYRFQLVGKRAELTWAEWVDEPPRTELVFIGRNFDPEALHRRVAACIDPQPEAVNPAQRITISRHRQ
jgi:G3E family GTPase